MKPLETRPPVYPPRCLRMGIEGTVRVRVLVGEDGRPQEVTIGKSSGESALDEAAMDAVRNWRFEPARAQRRARARLGDHPHRIQADRLKAGRAMHPTEALTTMSFANFLRTTDAVGLFVFGLLIVMSIVSWYFIFLKSARVVRIRTRSSRVVSTFWKTPADQAIGYLERQPDWEPFSKIALDGEFAMQHHDQLTEDRVAGTLHRAEFLDRALRASINRETDRLETGLTFLATVGSTAPFVGLFGTVWGIFHALVRIGASGETSLDQVAGPVGEALIMTALGLAVAVPGGARLQPAGAQQPRHHRELPRLRRGPARLPHHRRARAVVDGPPPRPPPEEGSLRPDGRQPWHSADSAAAAARPTRPRWPRST